LRQANWNEFSLVNDQGFSVLEAGKQPIITGELKDEDILAVSQTIQSYSLVRKMRRESGIRPMSSGTTRLEDSTLFEDRKNIARALVRVHNQSCGLNGIFKGKDKGLILTLFGPPGWRMTSASEATSEHVQ